MNTTKTLLGKGAFSDAYLHTDGTVELISCDPIKECMSMGWFPEGRLFPDVEYVAHHTDNLHKVYHMPIYARPTSIKKNVTAHDWGLYKALRALDIGYQQNPNNAFHAWHAAFDTLPDEYAAEREEIKEALDACGNYGTDILFEISPRNIAVQDGRLILLDCFYSWSTLKKTRSNKRPAMAH